MRLIVLTKIQPFFLENKKMLLDDFKPSEKVDSDNFASGLVAFMEERVLGGPYSVIFTDVIFIVCLSLDFLCFKNFKKYVRFRGYMFRLLTWIYCVMLKFRLQLKLSPR